MSRPKKRKVEVAETTAEDDAEAEDNTGVTGQPVPELDEAEEVTTVVDPASGLVGKKWKAAFNAFEEASIKAIKTRVLADEQEKQAKLAQRIFDAKWKRLEAGDKLKRRKKTFGAARRSYEAIIALSQAQHKCAVYQCCAAEAERDAARAEVRLNKLE